MQNLAPHLVREVPDPLLKAPDGLRAPGTLGGEVVRVGLRSVLVVGVVTISFTLKLAFKRVDLCFKLSDRCAVLLNLFVLGGKLNSVIFPHQ